LIVADFDKKTFNQAEWAEFEPQLWNWIKVNKRYILWITRTLNGGYHITFKAGIKANSLQNSLFWKGKSRGQLQWGDKYAVSGVSQGYQLFHPQQFLYLIGLIKRTPQPTLNRPKTIRSFNHLGLLMLRLRINLLDNSEPSEWQITFANFFAKQKNKRLNKRKEYTQYTLKEKFKKWAKRETPKFAPNFKTKIFESKSGNSDPPLSYLNKKLISKVSHFGKKMMILSKNQVERISFSSSSRDSQYWNIVGILDNQQPFYWLIDCAYRKKEGERILNAKEAEWVTINYQTWTDYLGRTANFIC